MTELPPNRIPRRTVLRAMGVGGLVLSPLVAACSGAGTGGAAISAPSNAGKKIKKGGGLRIGMSGGSTLSTLDPHIQADVMSVYPETLLFDQLTVMNPDFRLTNVLAEHFAPNVDGSEWTVTLRKGVTWHDGKPLTAEDVAFSFTRVLSLKVGTTAAGQISMIKSTRAKDASTVVFTLDRPCGWFDIAVGDTTQLGIVPVGFDPAKPVGTGPFVYKSWTAGVGAQFDRNPNYWGQVAYVDSLLISNINDQNARFNALLSDQIDIAAGVTTAQAAQVSSHPGLALYRSQSGALAPITMRTDTGPLADVRLRQAIKLCIDREQVLRVANGGFGRVGNDLYGIFDPDYDHTLKRTQDIDAATKLVQAAGKTGESLTLVTSEGAGMVEVCQVLAANAAKIGLDITVKVVDPATLWGPNYLSWDFAVDLYSAMSILTTSAVADGPYATTNSSHWNDPEYEALWHKASAALDPDERSGYLKQMQQILFDKGGWIIPAYGTTTGAYKADIGGLRNDLTGLGLSRNFNLVGFVE
jgi:peptide/nickel transport system substrate-binding protein